MMQIVQAPQDVLSAKAKRVEKFDTKLQELIDDMVKTLEKAKDPEGIGLAAPQVGRSLQLFIIKESPKSKVHAFINPVLMTIGELPKINKEVSDESTDDVKLEGCLSLKDIWGIVTRYEKVHLTYQDEKGKSHDKTFSGFFATIIQHEYDHIQGILFPKRVLEQEGKLYKSRKDKKGEMIFDEIKL